MNCGKQCTKSSNGCTYEVGDGENRDAETARVDNRSKEFKDCCISGPTAIIEEHDPNGEDAREELCEEEGLLSGKVWPPVEDGPKRSSMNQYESVAVKG